MHNRIHSSIASEAGAFSQDLARLFEELDRAAQADPLVGECAPPIDVRETDDGVEVSVDVPGVPASAIRVLARGDVLLIAGRKTPRRWQGDASFHLVERAFGRFARTLRLPCACDSGRARATLRNGELRIVFPRLTERRGRAIPITVTADA